MPNHDQLFKSLMESFFLDLLAIILPALAEAVEPSSVRFLRDEHFLDLPQGARRQADLLAEVRLKPPWLQVSLVHVEIERRASQTMARRLWDYNQAIRLRHGKSVFSLVIFLTGGQAGLHRNSWEEELPEGFPGPSPVVFTYWGLGLARASATEFLRRPEPLAWALAALANTNMPPERHKVECVRRILHAPVDPARRYLLLNCVETYLPLNSRQERSFRDMLIEREGPDSVDIYKTELHWVEEIKREAAEEGRREGRSQGRSEGALELLTEQIELRFGPVPDFAVRRLAALSRAQLKDLARRLLTADSLEDLDL